MTLANINFPVTDLEAAKKAFGALFGVEPHTDTPYYVGYNVGGLEIALNPGGSRMGMTGATPFWGVDDLEAATEQLAAAGASVTMPPGDVGGGTRLSVLNIDGNSVGLIANNQG
ncbi:putative enzyme related to lactoylglutathione lyase [Kineosphaera limosa]|uniref:VOC domain-containing protein n=1 Tax=Kineosphaera limosa NBRC 100340 TaxID=1184609 RepID=K6WRY2_9MICO|nr:VOC family protein [Kineosphaera limosa]NYE01187.1 putative enzyme related to lactoylglutathione lyase [Kineosphaera limosa]GAB96611.1 hypothetical protein KILIM_043_00160 [Kineosphaera limosa NBRC 100340]